MTESLFPLIRRLAYAVAFVLTLPLAPLWFIGIFLAFDSSDQGWFTCIGVGFLFFVFLFGWPFYLLASGIKWIFTGRGFA